jgi:hypothetical protein
LGRLAAAMLALGVVVLFAVVVEAQDRTLPEDFPLRLGDAFPTATGEATALVSARGLFPRRGANRVDIPVELDVGIAPRTQLSIATTASSEAETAHAGDLDVAARYQFWLQEGIVPSLAGRLDVRAPTGVGSKAWVLEAKAYATRYVTTNLFLHLNAAAVVVDRLEDDARRLRYRLAFGPSWIVPQLATLLLAGDVYAEQVPQRGEPTTVGLEVGFRYSLTSVVSWHGAVGTEVAGPGSRSRLTVTTGVAINFDIPGLK